MDGYQKRSLLVASPRLIDPNFFRSVVFILQHDDEGAVGIVLNRPTGEIVSDHLPTWADVAIEPKNVHFGGPVDPEVAIGLGRALTGKKTSLAGVRLVDLGSDPAEDVRDVRVFSGYAGWGTGQLEDEVAEGSWYPVDAQPDDPFSPAEGLWSRVLKRQPGHLALVSTFPTDVTLN